MEMCYLSCAINNDNLSSLFLFVHLKFRFNENEISVKVEELRRFLSEKEGITAKDKEGRSKYVQLYHR